MRRAIEINPNFYDPYYPLSELWIRSRKYEEAEKLLVAPFREDKENWQWPYQLGLCYGGMREWDKGISMAQLALKHKNSPAKIHLLLADLHSNKGERSKAISELEAFLKREPESPMARRAREVLQQLRQK